MSNNGTLVRNLISGGSGGSGGGGGAANGYWVACGY